MCFLSGTSPEIFIILCRARFIYWAEIPFLLVFVLLNVLSCCLIFLRLPALTVGMTVITRGKFRWIFCTGIAIRCSRKNVFILYYSVSLLCKINAWTHKYTTSNQMKGGIRSLKCDEAKKKRSTSCAQQQRTEKKKEIKVCKQQTAQYKFLSKMSRFLVLKDVLSWWGKSFKMCASGC